MLNAQLFLFPPYFRSLCLKERARERVARLCDINRSVSNWDACRSLGGGSGSGGGGGSGGDEDIGTMATSSASGPSKLADKTSNTVAVSLSLRNVSL